MDYILFAPHDSAEEHPVLKPVFNAIDKEPDGDENNDDDQGHGAPESQKLKDSVPANPPPATDDEQPHQSGLCGSCLIQ